MNRIRYSEFGKLTFQAFKPFIRGKHFDKLTVLTCGDLAWSRLVNLPKTDKNSFIINNNYDGDLARWTLDWEVQVQALAGVLDKTLSNQEYKWYWRLNAGANDLVTPIFTLHDLL